MTLAQMKQAIQSLPPVFRKLQAVVETLRASVVANTAAIAAVVDNRTLTLTTGWTDGTNGTGVALLTFLDADGGALTAPISGWMYISEVATGLTLNALDTGAAASKGVITPNIATDFSMFHFVTNATGELDLTLTSTADSYWIVFTQGNGSLLISDECAITGP